MVSPETTAKRRPGRQPGFSPGKTGKPAYNRKLKAERVIELAAVGLNKAEIAKTQGVPTSSIQRFLENYEIQKKDTEAYKFNRAELFSYTGAKFHRVASSIADELQNDIDNGVTAALEPDQKAKLARDVSVILGVVFDKERLERGQSTQNHSLITKMMGPALKDAGKLVSTPNDSP